MFANKKDAIVNYRNVPADRFVEVYNYFRENFSKNVADNTIENFLFAKIASGEVGLMDAVQMKEIAINGYGENFVEEI